MSAGSDTSLPGRRSGLFAKYVGGMIAVVTLVLVVNGAIDVWFSYQSTRSSLESIQQEKAAAAAQRVEQFIAEIERQIGWTTNAQWAAGTVEQRRFDFIRLGRQVPAITELVQIDGMGREQLKVSRLSMDVVDSQADWSADPRFREIQDKSVWYSPVYLRKDSEPYMSISVARKGRRSGATVAEVNLKLIWDVVSAIRVGKAGYAYVVDRDGKLIAHPDISLVLRATDMSRLEHVRAALAPAKDGGTEALPAAVGANLAGTNVLSTATPIPALGWHVFVELPMQEALQPLYTSLIQTGLLLLLGLALAAGAAGVLARRMMVPIRALGAGAERLGGGDLAHRIDVKSGDEIETLAGGFNRMAEQLQESYAGLEQKVATRTHELARSVEELTASGEILRLIASTPDDLQPMFQSILEHGTRLCDASFGVLRIFEGDMARAVAIRGAPPAYEAYLKQGPLPTTPDSGIGQVRHTRTPLQEADVRASTGYLAGDPARRAGGDLGGIRTRLAVPLIRQGEVIGVLSIYRQEVRAFSDKQVNLVATFADQAVIAIENSRLLGELRSRTQELGRSVEELTASGDILRIIAGSPDDLEPMFQSILEHAARLCEAGIGILWMIEGEMVSPVALHGVASAHAAFLRQGPRPIQPASGLALGRVIRDRVPVQVEDVRADPAYAGTVWGQVGMDVADVRTVLGVPLIRQGEVIGVLGVFRHEVRTFSDKQINLLSTFADQAVIAIENSRLLRELRSRTDELSESLEYQTATSEVLKVVSSSAFNLVPVLQTVAETAASLCHADEAAIFLRDGDAYRWAASIHINSAYINAVRNIPFLPGRDSLIGRTALEGKVVQIEDALADPEYGRRDLAQLGGVRTLLGVPLVRDGTMAGVMVLTRRQVEAFSDKQVEVLQVFADQAVIAVENVRLITEIQDKSRQLELASQHKSQFLANMSHELRTPLNAVLGYAELLLDGIYGELPDRARGVLDRVQSNGKHLLGLINDVLDLSKIEAGQLKLSLDAYALSGVVHTVVAATESLASAKGLKLKATIADGLPTGIGDERRLAQVLLNLVGNAIKFTDQGGIEIVARLQGGSFDIAVSDTGLGIAPEDQARIFEEFQQVDNTSTRKKGGTGLGLAISRRIVALHGGTMTVESEVGRGSTFRVTLPVRVEKQQEAA